MNRRVWSVLLFALFVGLLGCEAYQDLSSPPPEEGNLGLGRRNYGATYGRYSMDNDLCWQSIEPQSASEAVIQEAHAKCMAEKGWGQESEPPSESDSR